MNLSEYWMPHSHCVLDDPVIIIPAVLCDLAIFAAYMAIPTVLLGVISRHWTVLTFQSRSLLVHAGAFIASCGVTHLCHAWNWHHSDYSVEMASRLVTALVSLSFVFRLLHYVRHSLPEGIFGPCK